GLTQPDIPALDGLSSPFDAALPSMTLDQAAAQISRGNAPFNPGGVGVSFTMTYAYAATLHGYNYGGSGAQSFSQFTPNEIAEAERAIALWEDAANVHLVRVEDAGSEYSDNAQFLLWNYLFSTPGSVAFAAAGFGGSQFDSNTQVWHNFPYFNHDLPS